MYSESWNSNPLVFWLIFVTNCMLHFQKPGEDHNLRNAKEDEQVLSLLVPRLNKNVPGQENKLPGLGRDPANHWAS